ncbi:MAG: hypothetical protein JOZ75_13000 [Candidatus Dormibacteraeota bacterium]|nr:hypothetical protein [Candidatus Dormibacteraeota bacterium]
MVELLELLDGPDVFPPRDADPDGDGFGFGVAVGPGVGVGQATGVGAGVELGLGVALGVGTGVGDTHGVGVGVGDGVVEGVGVGDGVPDALTVGVAAVVAVAAAVAAASAATWLVTAGPLASATTRATGTAASAAPARRRRSTTGARPSANRVHSVSPMPRRSGFFVCAVAMCLPFAFVCRPESAGSLQRSEQSSLFSLPSPRVHVTARKHLQQLLVRKASPEWRLRGRMNSSTTRALGGNKTFAASHRPAMVWSKSSDIDRDFPDLAVASPKRRS